MLALLTYLVGILFVESAVFLYSGIHLLDLDLMPRNQIWYDLLSDLIVNQIEVFPHSALELRELYVSFNRTVSPFVQLLYLLRLYRINFQIRIDFLILSGPKQKTTHKAIELVLHLSLGSKHHSYFTSGAELTAFFATLARNPCKNKTGPRLTICPIYHSLLTDPVYLRIWIATELPFSALINGFLNS